MRPTRKDFERAQKAGLGKFIASEDQDRRDIVKWLKLVHPKVVFKVDYGADAELNPIQAKHQKDLMFARGWPDLMIYEPRGIYCGLAIEGKREDAKLYNSKGLFVTEHLEEQDKMLTLLEQRGWKTTFAKGYNKTIKIIEAYLKNPVTKNTPHA